MLKAGLPAVADADTRLFILGSLPGERSLRDQRYYAHPSNQFWKLVGIVIGRELLPLDYEHRLAALADRGIGLWDVVGAALREGSEDSAIRDAVHNPIGGLRAQYPMLEAIAFNGGRASRDGRRLLEGIQGVHLYDLVSSSGLARMPLSDKAARWSLIARHLK